MVDRGWPRRVVVVAAAAIGSACASLIGVGDLSPAADDVDAPGDASLDGSGEGGGQVGVRSLSLGPTHSCAVTATGVVLCWGTNLLGEIGDRGDAAFDPVPRPVVSGATQVACGLWSSCALLVDAGVVCWGTNNFGALGDDAGGPCTGAQAKSASPVPVDTGGAVAEISASGNFACARLARDGRIVCWGENRYGQLGHLPGGSGDCDRSATPLNPRPAPINGSLPPFRRLANASFHACALSDAGDVGNVFCWGGDDEAQLGRPPNGDACAAPCMPTAERALLDDGEGLRDIAAGGSTTCGLRYDGGVVCWGSNRSMQLGSADRGDTRPRRIDLEGARQLSVGTVHVCALLTDAGVACWGAVEDYALGDPARTDGSVPMPVKQLPPVRAVASGESFSCAVLADDGGVVCWGQNTFGELGHDPQLDVLCMNAEPCSPTPTPVALPP